MFHWCSIFILSVDECNHDNSSASRSLFLYLHKHLLILFCSFSPLSHIWSSSLSLLLISVCVAFILIWKLWSSVQIFRCDFLYWNTITSWSDQIPPVTKNTFIFSMCNYLYLDMSLEIFAVLMRNFPEFYFFCVTAYWKLIAKKLSDKVFTSFPSFSISSLLECHPCSKEILP